MTTSHVSHQRDHWAVSLSQGMTGWVLGTGMLAFHAGLFFLLMTGFTLWNLTQSPDDLWVTSLLRRWGAVLVFHAIAVSAGWAAYRLMKVPAHPSLNSAPPAPPTGRTGPQIVPPATSNGNGHGTGPWNVGADAVDRDEETPRLSAAERAAQWPGSRPRVRSRPPSDQMPEVAAEDVVIDSRPVVDTPLAQKPTDEIVIVRPAGNRNWSWVEEATATWLDGPETLPLPEGEQQISGELPPTTPSSDDATSPS